MQALMFPGTRGRSLRDVLREVGELLDESAVGRKLSADCTPLWLEPAAEVGLMPEAWKLMGCHNRLYKGVLARSECCDSHGSNTIDGRAD